MQDQTIPIIVEETAGIERAGEPVTFGIPFPESILYDEKRLSLTSSSEQPEMLQAKTLARWPDQSIKWVLIDFRACCLPNSTARYDLHFNGGQLSKENRPGVIIRSDNALTMKVDTGRALFVIDKRIFSPFQSVEVEGAELIDATCSNIVLMNEAGRGYSPMIENVGIDEEGPLRCTINFEGHFTRSGEVFADFMVRLSFFAGSRTVKLDFTIRNPKAALHDGGLWDLGDEGSVYFSDLSLHLALKAERYTSVSWKTGINETERNMDMGSLEIYQDSSGGENWDSPAHMNRYGSITNKFRGYKVYTNSVEDEEGERATPLVRISEDRKFVAATVKNFWQNFPKAIKAGSGKLSVKLFPDRHDDLFELQGGEQKTHTIYLHYGSESGRAPDLGWVHSPLIPRASCDWYAESMALGYMAPSYKDLNPAYQKLVDNAISGRQSFFNLREKIDEYGWRNFGDVYASHEEVAYKGDLRPFVSHYNNQYDILNGCILQFARTGNIKWHTLMCDLAKHIIDIDIYHTKKDRPAFSGGHFWHTDHFMHAATSTHRSYSRRNKPVGFAGSYGGGPSPHHCYTTGLTGYYYLSGDVMAKDAVIELSEWIMNGDSIEPSLLGLLRKGKQKILSLFNRYSHAPGRGEANSINTLLDAYELTKERRYLSKSESIIRKFISPADDIDRLNQQQIELRWFYLIFLQAVGKYLDVKDNMNERDIMYNYARASLLYHAEWMLRNEVPYMQMFHMVEIPSSTWPAHDVRKSAIFDFAYKYSDNHLKNEFKERAEFFFNRSLEDVMSFDDGSRTYARPLAVLMHYGVMHTYFQNTTDNKSAT